MARASGRWETTVAMARLARVRFGPYKNARSQIAGNVGLNLLAERLQRYAEHPGPLGNGQSQRLEAIVPNR